MGPATGSLAPIPYELPFQFTTEAATLTAQIPTEALAAAATAIAVRNQQMAEFTPAAGTEAHAAVIAVGATENEAAQVAQAAARAALTSAQAAIAGADAPPPHRLRRRGPRHQPQDRAPYYYFILFLKLLTHQTFFTTYPTQYKLGGSHKWNTPGRRQHKRRRSEAEGVHHLAAGAPQKEWRERATREDPSGSRSRGRRGGGRTGTYGVYRGGRHTSTSPPQWRCVERSLSPYPRDTTQPSSTNMPG